MRQELGLGHDHAAEVITWLSGLDGLMACAMRACMYVSACWCSHACLYFQTRQQHVNESIIQSSRPLSHVMTAGRVVAAAEAAGTLQKRAFWGERCPLQQHWAWARCSPILRCEECPVAPAPGSVALRIVAPRLAPPFATTLHGRGVPEQLAALAEHVRWQKR